MTPPLLSVSLSAAVDRHCTRQSKVDLRWVEALHGGRIYSR